MDIHPATTEYAKWTVTADADLATATADVYIEGAWQALTWDAAATQSGSTWTRVAKLLVRGASAVGGLLITANAYSPDVRVTITGGEVIVRDSTNRITLKATP